MMTCKQYLLELKYKEILKELQMGKSLTKISKERKICHKNLSNQLRRRFPQECDTLIYGRIIGKYNGYELRKIPKNTTSRTDTALTRKAKEILIKKYDLIEEVGIWLNNFKLRYAVDLYSLKDNIAIELYWQSPETFKQLKKKLNNYKSFSKRVICVLLKDSRFRNKNRSYLYLKNKLLKAGFEIVIMDISDTPTTTETPSFPLEINNGR